MLKLTMCVKRKSHLTREEFDAYWRDHHGPLVVSYMGLLRLRRYVQTTALSDESAQEAIRVSRNALKSNFDGCAELWWDSLEELTAVRSSPEGAKVLRELLADEDRFLDLSQSQLWYGVEREIIDNRRVCELPAPAR